MPVTKQNLDDVFSYHAPKEDQPFRYAEIRAAAKVLAEAILEHTPQCADQQAALRHVREAVMTANAAVALEGLI
jgi:hypothetical protein